jgi:hypothetical protein
MDEDGLGFPIFAFAGISTPISYVWDFGGGTSSSPLAIFAERPVVTFELAPGEEERIFELSLTVFDATGLSNKSEGRIRINRSGRPLAQLILDGDLVSGEIDHFEFRPVDPQVRFGVLAFDESGLGFPIFAPFGQPAAVSFLWDFGGGQPANALEVFSPSPTVTFPVGPGRPPRRMAFTVTVTVFDATGQSITRTVIVAYEP